MELYVRGVTFVSVVALSYFFTYKAKAAIGVCDIPAGSSPLAGRNQPPVRFTFTTIQGDPDFIFDPLNIEDHFIIVKSSCFMTLYVKSANIPRDPLPSGTKVAGQPLACESQSSEKLQVTGFVLKYMGQEIADRRAEVPESWYQGNRMVQEIRFYSFPETSPVTIRCGVRQTVQVLGNVAVYAEATITRIGCPKTSYGNRCEKECPCKNGGYCHTFESTCFCPKDYKGNTCEINLARSASPNNTAVTPPPPQANTSRRTEESDPNAVEDDNPGGSAVRLLSGCSFLLCGTILQIIISSR